jgi:hypothetical protein
MASCQRCRLPIISTRYALRVEADSAEATVVEFSLCESCLSSMQRWLNRNRRKSRLRRNSESRRESEFDLDGTRIATDLSEDSRSRRNPARRSHHTAALEQGERLVHARLVLTTSAMVAVFVGLIALLAWTIFRK